MDPLDLPIQDRNAIAVDADGPSVVTDYSIPEPLSFRAVPWRVRHILIGILPFIGFLLLSFSSAIGGFLFVIVFGLLLFTEIWMIVYPLAIAWGYGWRPRFTIHPFYVLMNCLIAGLVLVSLWVLLTFGYLAWVALFGEPPLANNPMPGIVRSSDPVRFLLAIGLMIVVAPISEEVFFRGLLYRALSGFTPRVSALVIQAVAFGLLHFGYGLVHVVMASVMGVVFALLYDMRRTLSVNIFCHGFHNAAVLGMYLLAMGWSSNPPTIGIDVVPHESGVLVTKVYPNSGAEAAGIQPGDVLYSVNGYGARNGREIATVIWDKKSGETIAVEYIRDGQIHKVDLVLRSRKELTE